MVMGTENLGQGTENDQPGAVTPSVDDQGKSSVTTDDQSSETVSREEHERVLQELELTKKRQGDADRLQSELDKANKAIEDNNANLAKVNEELAELHQELLDGHGDEAWKKYQQKLHTLRDQLREKALENDKKAKELEEGLATLGKTQQETLLQVVATEKKVSLKALTKMAEDFPETAKTKEGLLKLVQYLKPADADPDDDSDEGGDPSKASSNRTPHTVSKQFGKGKATEPTIRDEINAAKGIKKK